MPSDLTIKDNTNNDINNVNIYSALVVARPLREFIRFIRLMQTRQAAANARTKPTDFGCESAVGCCGYSPLPIIIITQPEG